MKDCINKLILLIIPVFISTNYSFSQYSSKIKYKGNWENSTTWNPVWANPQTNISGINININGYVTVNGPLTIGGNSGNLIINDTLVVKGDLTLGDNNDLQINNYGILIVWGNLTIVRHADIATNGYLIVVNDIIKTGHPDDGSLTYNQNPAKVFIGGSVPPELTNNNPDYPALNCSHPNAYSYANSNCSYGNIADLASTPAFDFYRSTCTINSPTVSTSGALSFCSGESVTLTSSSGATYLWSNGASTQNINVTASGSYSVKVTNSNQCLSSSSETVVVNVKPTPAKPVITPSGSLDLCQGTSMTLNSNALTGNSWNTGATSQIINVSSSGSYQVKVTDNGCESEYSDIVQVNVKPAPATPTITASGALTFCSGDSVVLTASAAYRYLWSTGETTQSIKVKESGNYTVTVTNNDGCESSASAITQVNVLPHSQKPTVTSSNPLSFCLGDSVILTSESGITYEWSTGATTKTINVKTSGDYKVRVTDEKGCRSLFSEIIQVVVKPLPAKPSISASGDLNICNGDTVLLESAEASSYLWSTGATSKAIKAFLPGEYRVKVIDANGCKSSFSDGLQVVVNSLPEIPVITASGPLTFCHGDSVMLTSSLEKNYLWSSGAASQSIVVHETGTFSVIVTNENGCESEVSDEAIVTVNPVPSKPVITTSGPLNFCFGDSVVLTSGSDVNYLWSTGAATQSIIAKNSGVFKVKVSNENGCESEYSDEVQVIVHQIPEKPSISASGPVNFCIGDSVILTSAIGFEYHWSTGESTSKITVKKAGNYSVSIKNSEGCISEISPEVSIVVHELPLVSIQASESMCLNSMMEVKGSPEGGTYKVSNKAATIQNNQLRPSTSGTITIEYNYAGLCSNTATKNIVVTEPPQVYAGPDQELAFTHETQMQAVLSSSDQGEWILISGKGQISDIHLPTTLITDLGEGENVFQWKVSNGDCLETDEVTITVSGLYIPSVITPNGDGENDYFYIDPEYGKLKLIIFNKWGKVEYTADNYLNNWNGLNNKGVELPDDTYFYVLHFGNGIVKKGSLLIKR